MKDDGGEGGIVLHIQQRQQKQRDSRTALDLFVPPRCTISKPRGGYSSPPSFAANSHHAHRAAFATVDRERSDAGDPVVRWRLIYLMQRISEEFRITIAKQTLRAGNFAPWTIASSACVHASRSEGSIEDFKKLARPPGRLPSAAPGVCNAQLPKQQQCFLEIRSYPGDLNPYPSTHFQMRSGSEMLKRAQNSEGAPDG
jgi:hypothetical protein